MIFYLCSILYVNATVSDCFVIGYDTIVIVRSVICDDCVGSV